MIIVFVDGPGYEAECGRCGAAFSLLDAGAYVPDREVMRPDGTSFCDRHEMFVRTCQRPTRELCPECTDIFLRNCTEN